MPGNFWALAPEVCFRKLCLDIRLFHQAVNSFRPKVPAKTNCELVLVRGKLPLNHLQEENQMRISAVLRSLVPLLAMAATPLLRAQFQAPTQEELSMTADPKAPGAAAVYLNIDEVSDDQLHYYSKYVRIKVLQDKGK